MGEKEEALLVSKEEFNKCLHQWYYEFHRQLPWRSEPSLYKTVVSEFMLQQTQVDTVLPYFKRWLEVLPDFETLARSNEEEVVKQWEGLGYYSRARNLHKLAKEIITKKEIPQTPKEWLEFPGVGPYTAAAITSIAFMEPTAVVDGNVIRILTRLTANENEFKDNGVAVKALTPLANALLHKSDPNTHNQAVMELGATVCTRANPLCTVCPVVKFCAGAKNGIAEQLPKLIPKKIEQIVLDRIWIIHEDKLLLNKISSDAKRLANMYELPESDGFLKDLVSKKAWAVKKRGISNQRIQENIFRPDKSPTPSVLETIEGLKNLKWIGIGELDSVTLSGPHKRWISELLEQGTD